MPKLSEILSTLTPDQLARATPHLMKLEQAQRQSQRDDAIAEAVLRTLTRKNNRRLGDQIRAAILKGATE